MARFPCLADNHKGLAVKLFRYGRGLLARFEITQFELAPLAFETGFVGLGRPLCFASGQQKIAGIAILHPDGVSHLAQLANTLKQYNFHHDTLL